METLANFILKHKNLILIFFMILVLVSGVLALKVPINYDITDYLPENTPSSEALITLEEEFQDDIPSLSVVVKDYSREEILDLKAKISSIPEVTSVLWLDDIEEMIKPLPLLTPEMGETFLKDNHSQLQVSVDTKDYVGTLDKIKAVLDGGLNVNDEYYLSGQLVVLSAATTATMSELSTIMLFAVPVVIIILFIATKSWFEPVLFLLGIGIAIILNLGTNFFLGEVSFITMAIASILQLAVSMDYAIFLLFNFNQNRKSGMNHDDAMTSALSQSFSVILSSASTTFIGFLSLIFMRFLLGPDLGVVLAKGIIFSLLTTFTFLPCFASITYKWIDRTAHRSLLPSEEAFRKVGKFSGKIGLLVLVATFIFTLPLYNAKERIDFLYGMEPFTPDSKEYKDEQYIKNLFGDTQTFILMVPKGSPEKELALAKELNTLPYVTQSLSLGALSGEFPRAFLPEGVANMLEGENLSRFILTVDLDKEGPKAFAGAEEIRNLANLFYKDEAQLVGETYALLDIKDVIQQDNLLVNWLTIISVAVVLAISFRSISLPILLVFTIELAIWLNLATVYLSGRPLNYIGYLIISTIQLGATVDYGILYTENYLRLRIKHDKKEALVEALTMTLPAILPPALILSSVGFLLQLISSIPIVSDIGMVLGRGALASLASVVFLLPILLRVFDPVIRVTTRSIEFKKQ